MFLSLFIYFWINFYWNIVVLQCFSLYSTEGLISYTYTCILSLLNIPPPSPHPILLVITEYQDGLPVLYINFPIYQLASYFIHDSVCISVLLSQFVPPSPCVHKSVLYICVFIPSLQMGSSVPFFQIPYVHFNIQYLFFSFWLI